MKKNKKKLLLLIAPLILLTIAAWMYRINHLEKLTPKNLGDIRVPIDIWTGNYWIIVADAKGYFKEEGLSVKITDVSRNFTESVRDFVDKVTLDTNNFSIFDLVKENMNGADLVAVLVSDSSLGAEGLVAKKKYTKLSELRGKRIGIELGSYLDYFLEVAMSNSKIYPEEYTKVNLLSDELIEKFDREKLDAAFTWEPDLSEIARRYDAHVIMDTSDITGLSPGVFVFKRKFMETRPETIQAFVNAWKKASDFISKYPEETYTLVSRIDFVDHPGEYYNYEEVKELAQTDVPLTYADNLKAFSFSSGFESLYGNLQYVSRFIQKANQLNKIPNTNRMLTDYFLQRVTD